MSAYTNNNSSSGDKEAKPASPEYSSTDIKSVIPGTQYYFLQKDYKNLNRPVYIERYHEDITIYICLNHAGDGIVFRDQAMSTEYKGYKKHLEDIGKTEEEISAINFDSLSLNLDSVAGYPGIYTFVYDESVPEYMRVFAPSIESKPMSLSSYSLEGLGSGLSKMSVSYVFYYPNDKSKQKEYSMQERSNPWEVGDRLIPSGANLNKLFDLSGKIMNAAWINDEKMVALKEAHTLRLSDLKSKYDKSVADMLNSRTSLKATSDQYQSQLSILNVSASAIVTEYPYVLQPTKNYTAVELRSQTNKRSEYNSVAGKIQSLNSLIKSTRSSLDALEAQIAKVTKSNEDSVNKEISEFNKESLQILDDIKTLRENLYIARSFKLSVPLSSRNSGFTKFSIYDHYKNILTSSQLSSTASSKSNVASYRERLKKKGSDSKLFYGTGYNLSKDSWKMIYFSEDISSNSKYVNYYSVNKTNLAKTLLTRAEYLSEIASVTGTETGGLAKNFEIALIPPPISYLKTGAPTYDFSSIHTTTNLRGLKRKIDGNKMFSSPSIAVDFGDETGQENTISDMTAVSQQTKQGSYRCVTNFKVLEEGPRSDYTLSWRDSSDRKIDLKRKYSSKIFKPNISRDVLNSKYKALEFTPESVSLSSNPFVQDYAFEDGFSIFLLVRQNETNTSVGSADLTNKFRSINSLYPNEIYKNKYFEIERPSDFADTSSGKDYKLEYSLNSMFERNKLLNFGKENALSLIDTYGIYQDQNHIPTTKLSSASNGYSAVSGFSKANLFTANAYSIINIKYSGKQWSWYKNGELLNSSSAQEDFFERLRADIINIGGLLDEKEVSEYYKKEDQIYKLLVSLKRNQNLTDFQINRLNASIVNETEKLNAITGTTDRDNALKAERNASIAKFNNEIADHRKKLDESLKSFKNDIYRIHENFSGSGFAGEIAELIIYSGAVSEETRVLTEGYLACKFNLSYLLPKSHIYKSSCPLISNNVVTDPYALADSGIESVFRKQNLSDLFVYTTSQKATGEWKPSWFPLRTISSQGSIYTENATWDRATNRLTLHRAGAENVVTSIDIYDTLTTVLRPVTGIMVPNVTSFVDAIFPYATSSSSEQLSLSPAQEGFYKIINFSSRAAPDHLWETNVQGDKAFGGNYITSSASPSSTDNFANNTDIRKRSSSIYNGIINKVGGTNALQRATKVHYASGFDSTTNFTPNASPIKVLSAMEFSNGARAMYLDALTFDGMFTLGKEWSQADSSASPALNDFEAVAINLIKENGNMYSLAFLRPGDSTIESRYKSIIDAEFSDVSNVRRFIGFNPLEQREVSLVLFDTYDSSPTSRIKIDPYESFSLEFSVYLAKDGEAKFGSVNRKVNSGFFISNCRFTTSDEKVRRTK